MILFSILFYYALYFISIIINLPTAYIRSRSWESYIPESKTYILRNINTKKLQKEIVKVNHEKFSENIFYSMSMFFPIYEGGIVKQIHVNDISRDSYVSAQERKHIKVHTDLNRTIYSKSIRKYLELVYNFYVSNKFTGIGNYVAEIGFYFKAEKLIPNIKNLVKDPNIQRVFAWHLYEEFEHGFDFGLPIIKKTNIFLRFFLSLIGLFHYRNIWLLCVELPSIALCINHKPTKLFKFIYNGLYLNTWKKGEMDALVLVATTLQKFPSREERILKEKNLKSIIKNQYNIDIDDSVIYF